MAVNAGKVFVELIVKGKEQVKSQLDGVQKRMKAFGGAMRKMGSIFAKGLAVGATATLAGLAVVLKKSITAASDMQETMNKFNVVFGESASAVKQWSDETAGAFGRSKEQIASTVAGYQDLLVPMGMTGDAAQVLSKDLVALGLDVASFNNSQDADVTRDFQAALTGSGEVMKKYGVVLSEAAVKAELLAKGIDPKTATNAQKVMARYNIILAGTSAAHGDVARSGGSWANQVKAIKARASDFLTMIGQQLLPILENWAADMSALMSILTDTSSELGGTESAVGSLATGLEALGSPIELAVKGFSAIAMVVRAAQAAISKYLSIVAGSVKAIASTGAAKTIFGDAADDVAQLAEAMEDTLGDTAEDMWDRAGQNAELAFGDEVSQRFAEARAAIRRDREGANRELNQIADFTDPMATTADEAADKMKEAASQMVKAAQPETLDATRDVKAYTQFEANRSGAHLRALEKQTKLLAEIAKKKGVGVV